MQALEIISASPGFVGKASVGKGLGRFSGADYFNQHTPQGVPHHTVRLGISVPSGRRGCQHLTS